MPVVNTEQFGPLPYEETAAIHFPRGLPGFETEQDFVILERPGAAPLVHLQSLETPSLSLLSVPVQAIEADYELLLQPEDRRALQCTKEGLTSETILCMAVLAVDSDGVWTANLMAPIVINLANQRAIQAVRPDQRYSHLHELASEQHAANEEQTCS